MYFFFTLSFSLFLSVLCALYNFKEFLDITLNFTRYWSSYSSINDLKCIIYNIWRAYVTSCITFHILTIKHRFSFNLFEAVEIKVAGERLSYPSFIILLNNSVNIDQTLFMHCVLESPYLGLWATRPQATEDFTTYSWLLASISH